MKEKSLTKRLVEMQKQELVAHYMYKKAAKIAKDPKNAEVLNKMAAGEKSNYETFKSFSGKEVTINPIKLKFTMLMVTLAIRIIGLTFVLKYFERDEDKRTKINQPYLTKHKPEVLEYIKREETNEQLLLDMINEDRLNYTSSIVLGLNDALVERTGALAGFTLSMHNSKAIAVLGLITGISASLSIAASEYLSTKSENDPETSPIKSSVYAGLTYLTTVILLIIPFLLISNYIITLVVTMFTTVIIIAVFNYYISVVKNTKFGKQFGEMAIISIGVAIISFVLGFLVNRFIGI